MKRPDFQEKTEVKVIDRGHHLYSKRGVVTAINGFDDVLKEEPETVKAIGAGAGKFISAEAAKHARRIVVGDCR